MSQSDMGGDDGFTGTPTAPSYQGRFDHFVITRFSAVFSQTQPPATDEWLRYRLGFFAEATCASLERQTGSPIFRWLVFFDDRCSIWFRDQIKALSRGLFEPVWSSQTFTSSLVAREVASRSSAEYVITTRIDSDDAVAKRFISAVQSEFDSQELMFVDFPLGYQMDRSGAIYSYQYPSNAFISLIEKCTESPPRTVFGHPQHGKSLTVGPVREVITKPIWMQVVHGSNIANDIRGRRVLPHLANELFDFELTYRQHVSMVPFAVESLWQAANIFACGPRHRGWRNNGFTPI